MAFKTAKDYNEEKFGGLFLLRNDGDYADVIFMYRNEDDVLVADTHYIKSPMHTGYAHCLGKGCPACAKGIRLQTKLFIPLYNMQEEKIQFWDRSMRFESQLNHDVFQNYPTPIDIIFRITRHGAANDINTTYEITPKAANRSLTYEGILAKFNTSSPAYYENVCKSVSADDMYEMVSNKGKDNYTPSAGDMPDYQVTPRFRSSVPSAPPAPPLPDYLDEPEMLTGTDSSESVENLDDADVVF